jgi:hypothetical protein
MVTKFIRTCPKSEKNKIKKKPPKLKSKSKCGNSSFLEIWKKKIPPKLRVWNPEKKKKKKKGFGTCANFSTKKKGRLSYHTQVHFVRTLTIEIGKIKIKERESR